LILKLKKNAIKIVKPGQTPEDKLELVFGFATPKDKDTWLTAIQNLVNPSTSNSSPNTPVHRPTMKKGESTIALVSKMGTLSRKQSVLPPPPPQFSLKNSQDQSTSPPTNQNSFLSRSNSNLPQVQQPANYTTNFDPNVDSLSNLALEDDDWDAPPPNEWKEVGTPDGKVYYYNRRTRETSWRQPPPGSVIITIQMQQMQQNVQNAWQEAYTEDGRLYYYNLVTKEVSWPQRN